jgi:hypothetical protein
MWQPTLLIAELITKTLFSPTTMYNMEIALTITTTLEKHPRAKRLSTAREQQQRIVPCNNGLFGVVDHRM